MGSMIAKMHDILTCLPVFNLTGFSTLDISYLDAMQYIN